MKIRRIERIFINESCFIINPLDCDESFQKPMVNKDICLEIFKHLKNRGWKVSEDSFVDKLIRCDYKIAVKGSLFMEFETYPACIKIKIDIKNNLFPDSNNLRPEYHYEEYIKLSYLEKKARQLELLKLLEMFKPHCSNICNELKPVHHIDFILRKESQNPHIHGGPKTLEGIKEYCDKDLPAYNSTSGDKEILKCGEEKYFYYRGVLSKGIIYHNINNMWWVLMGDDCTNIACFELFNYHPGLLKRKLPRAAKLEALIDKFQKKRHYQKCAAIYKHGLDLGIFNPEEIIT